jgi:hypothetical protein
MEDDAENKLMEDDAENNVRTVVNAAKAGDPTAMRLCIERLAPVRKGRPERSICRKSRLPLT